MRCYQRYSQIDFPFMGFLPSVPLLFPPDDDSYRKAALSTTGDLGERCKDPQRVLGRAPADNTLGGCI